MDGILCGIRVAHLKELDLDVVTVLDKSVSSGNEVAPSFRDSQRSKLSSASDSLDSTARGRRQAPLTSFLPKSSYH